LPIGLRFHNNLLTKEAIRHKIWQALEENDVADFPRPCFGRIPNFKGSRKAAELIKQLPEFKKARCVFCAPDFVLKRVREIVLETGKTLAAALPHMTSFVEITERNNISTATSIKGLKRYGRPLSTPVDLFVQGCVAVDRYGNRLGKGKGYGDKEWAYLKKHNLLRPGTTIVVFAHPLQIVDDLSPLMSEHDQPANFIITPNEIITLGGRPQNH